MGTFCNEKRLLLNLKEAVSLLEESIDEEERKALYYYINSTLDVLECFNINNLQELIEYDEEEFNKYMKLCSDDFDRLTFNIYRDYSSYKNIFDELINNYLDIDFDDNVDDFSLTKEDFFAVFRMFCEYLGKEKEFNNIYKKGIIKTKSNENTDFMGRLIFNPSNNIRHIVISDFDYTFNNLVTLVHEFGHYVDFGDMIENKSYNDLYNYINKTTNFEINSLLYEKLFIKYLEDNKIFNEELNNYLLFLKYHGLNFIYNTLYSIDSSSDTNQSNANVNNIKNNNIYELNDITLLTNMTYGVGEYYSTILMDDIEKNGLESNLYKKFYDNRYKSMGLEFLNNEDFNTKKFNEVEDKQLKYLKKQLNNNNK